MSDCSNKNWRLTLQFDGQNERRFRFEIDDVGGGSPDLTGQVFEINTDGSETLVSNLTGSCRDGKSGDGSPKVMDLSFNLGEDMIFMAGRVRAARFFDGRFRAFAPRRVGDKIFREPGDTGTGGGSQT